MALVADTALNHHSLTHSLTIGLLSCRHGVKPPLTHSLTIGLHVFFPVLNWRPILRLSWVSVSIANCSCRFRQRITGLSTAVSSKLSSCLTHEFLLKGEPPPECIPCNCPLTIKHLLIECGDFNDVRQRFYQVPSLQDLFKTGSDFRVFESSCAVQTFMSCLID